MTPALEREMTRKFPGDLRRIAEVAGVEAAIKIGMSFKGTNLYIGARVEMIRELRDSKIREEFDRGISVKRLSIKYKLSERQIRKVLCGVDDIPEEAHGLISKKKAVKQ